MLEFRKRREAAGTVMCQKRAELLRLKDEEEKTSIDIFCVSCDIKSSEDELQSSLTLFYHAMCEDHYRSVAIMLGSSDAPILLDDVVRVHKDGEAASQLLPSLLASKDVIFQKLEKQHKLRDALNAKMEYLKSKIASASTEYEDANAEYSKFFVPSTSDMEPCSDGDAS